MTDFRKNDCTVLYYNPKERKFLIAGLAQDGLALVEIGSLTEITDAAFDRDVSDTLFRHLDAFRKNVYDALTARRGSRETNRVFVREHLSLQVERLPSGDLVIKPLHHERGGYVGKSGEHIILRKENVRVELASALRRAFDMAS